MPLASRQETQGHFRRFDHQGAGTAHGIQNGFFPRKATRSEKEGGQRLAQRRLADGWLVAPLMEQLTGRIDTDCTDIVLDPDHEPQIRVRCHGRPETLPDGRGNPLCSRPGMIDARAAAGRINPHGHIRSQKLIPGKSTRLLVKLGQMRDTHGSHTHEHPGGAAQSEISAPDLRP